MVSIGKVSGRKVVALISDMNQPLGEAVGNALEVIEAIHTLNGHGPKDFTEHCLVVASHLLVIGEKAKDLVAARKMVEKTWKSGAGWQKFRELVIAQGGDVGFVDDPKRLPKAKLEKDVKASKSGCLKEVNAREVGETSVELGAGREKKGDLVDPAVGIIVHKKVGDPVKGGDVLFTIYANDQEKLGRAKVRLLNAVRIVPGNCKPLPLFYDVIQ